MRYKMTKKYHICHHHIRFFSSSKCTKILRFQLGLRPGPRWGSLRRSPRLPSRPPPHSPPHSTPKKPSASRTRRLRRIGSQAPAPLTQNPGYTSAQGCSATIFVGVAAPTIERTHSIFSSTLGACKYVARLSLALGCVYRGIHVSSCICFCL